MISIIVAARNEENHLEHCIRSLLKQSYQDFEIIIIDGKSDDKTLTIAKKLARKYKNIRVYENPAQRAAEARNIGFSHAKGKLICYIDAHTTATPKWLEALVTTLNKHPTWKGKPVGGVGSVHRNPNKERFSSAVSAAFQHPLGGGGSSYRKGGKLRAVDTSYACIYTREALDAVQRKDGTWYDPYFVKGQDADLNWRINKAGFALLQQPRATTHYYKRGSWGAVWRQMYVAGFWRSKLSAKYPELIKPTLYAPLSFYLLLIASLFWQANITAALLIIYVAALLISNLGNKQAITVTGIIILIHIAYTMGLIKGILFKHNTTKDRV